MSPVAFTSSDLNKIKCMFEGKARVFLILVLPLVIHTRPHKRSPKRWLWVGCWNLKRGQQLPEENLSETEQKERVRHRMEFGMVGVLPKEWWTAGDEVRTRASSQPSYPMGNAKPPADFKQEIDNIWSPS